MQELKGIVERRICEHRGWFVFQGIVFLIFGFLAAILPGVAALSMTLLIGAALAVTGIFQLIATIRSQTHWWSVASALLSIGVGGWMLWAPVIGLLALTMTLAIFLAAEGIFEVLLAYRFRPVRGWGWILTSGIASLALSALLWSGFPGWSPLYLGLIVAVNFIFYGASMLILAGSVAAHERPL